MCVQCTFICHLLYVAADFGHHQVDFTTYKKGQYSTFELSNLLQTEGIFRQFDKKFCKKIIVLWIKFRNKENT
jgi:hypothetical protein